MTQIRNNLTKAFAVFAVFFIVYIVLDWGMDITGRKHQAGTREYIGVVDGTKITYSEFSALLKQWVGFRQGESDLFPPNGLGPSGFRDASYIPYLPQESQGTQGETLETPSIPRYQALLRHTHGTCTSAAPSLG